MKLLLTIAPVMVMFVASAQAQQISVYDARNHDGVVQDTGVDVDSAAVDTLFFWFQNEGGTGLMRRVDFNGALTAIGKIDTVAGEDRTVGDSTGVRVYSKLLFFNPLTSVYEMISNNVVGDTTGHFAAATDWLTNNTANTYEWSTAINPRACDGIAFIIQSDSADTHHWIGLRKADLR